MPSGKATAGAASAEGEAGEAPALALGPLWHPELPSPKPSENRCLAACSQEGVGWGGGGGGAGEWWTFC